MSKRYGPGDKVFAKVRGYPPWPARVEGVADETPNKMKYHVFFYGTRETAICKSEELYTYIENREKYGKPMKKRGFNEGISQIEMELGLTPKASLSQPTATPGENSYDSDAGEGNLVIDETPQGNSLSKKLISKTPKSAGSTTATPNKQTSKGVKRKLEVDDKSSDEPEQTKIKGPSVSSGRKSTTATPQTDSSKQNNSEIPVTSRSGRKIKPKKFADEALEETGGSSPNQDGSMPPSKLPSVSIKLSPVTVTPNLQKVAKKQDGDKISSDSDGKKTKDDTIDSVTISDREVIESMDSDVMIALTPGGQEVKIELNSNKPASFKNEKARLQWHADTLKKAHELKAQIESGKVIPDGVRKEIEERHHARQKMIEEVSKSCPSEDKAMKLVYLRIEAQLLDIDINIKSSLNLVQADPDYCLRILDELLELQITPLMLKKHPECVETIKKLRKYIGNIKRWKMTEEESKIFASKAAMIRAKAEHVYNKFKTLFSVPEGKTFREAFAEELAEFTKKTKSMTIDELFALVKDPVEAEDKKQSEEDKVEENVKNSLVASE
ncbi:uncharacterized protein LOC142322060 [Lycorma delicatula]|uniref:uncharacterized protein LOC142322060 n=1 Tax=Lycorma delicatula TaxID=130591 RepID=UPI003F5117B8